MIQYDQEKLKRLMVDFYALTHIKICLLNDRFEEILFYPERFNSFCSLIHSSEQGTSICRASDAEALETCKRTKKYHVYVCPMGLTEAVAPILIADIIVGFIMLGQVRNENQSLNEILARTHALGLPDEPLINALHALSVETSAKIASASHILDACASYVYLSKQVEIIGNDTAQELNDFIDSHLGSDLNVETLCSEFLLTRVQLYEMFHRYYGRTVAGQIRTKRMEKAAELLKTTDMLVKDIAHQVNQDYNYFSKEFSKYYGITPKAFQKKAQVARDEMKTKEN